MTSLLVAFLMVLAMAALMLDIWLLDFFVFGGFSMVEATWMGAVPSRMPVSDPVGQRYY